MTSIPASELIINPNGSIYHLHVKPGQLSDIIFTVGDQNRVQMVSKYFEKIEFENQYREFKTVTGEYKGRRLSVISTGIGIDNIDICVNELDALFNIDFETRQVKKQKRSLSLIRLGTSGSLHEAIPIDSILVSRYGIEFNGMLSFYNYQQSTQEKNISYHVQELLNLPMQLITTTADQQLVDTLGRSFQKGITYSAIGFYAPQGRQLRLPSVLSPFLLDELSKIEVNGYRFSNIEMETAVLYGLCNLLGHKAISFNTLLANRATKKFSSDAKGSVDKMIREVLDLVIAYC